MKDDGVLERKVVERADLELMVSSGTSVCFAGVASSKEPAYQLGDIRDSGSIPGSGRFVGVGNGTHTSILAWKIPFHGQKSLEGYTVHGVAKSCTQLND